MRGPDQPLIANLGEHKVRIHELLSEINQRDAISIEPDIGLFDAAELMSANNIGALPVVDRDDFIKGILSERDILRSFVAKKESVFKCRIADVMTESVVTCSNDDDVDDVYEKMSAKKIRHVPVAEDGKLVSILSIRDFENVYRAHKERSATDGLTGLYNSRHFLQMLDAEFNRYRRFESPFSVAVVQVEDHRLPDTSSDQSTMDVLLREIAACLIGHTRIYDCVGRVEDTIFGILFPSTLKEYADRACHRIARAIQSTVPHAADGSPQVVITIGVAVSDRDSRNGQSVMEQAVKHMLRAAGEEADDVESAPKLEPQNSEFATI